jgi:diguanylate cyclase (GGDEF)-like protein/PAS domain S-box-containing protein
LLRPAVHRLFNKQLEKAARRDGSIDVEVLGRLVSDAYEESDRDRRRTERSIALMIEELDQFNAQLRVSVENRTRELAIATAMLNNTLAHMDEGIVMIDAEGRVMVYNRRFVAFSGLTEAQCANRPLFRDLVDIMAANGEFVGMPPEFQRWTATEAHVPGNRNFTRVRPDGTVLRVQTKQLPGGGEVRVLSDISDLVERSKALEQTQRALEETLENVSQGIMKISADRRIEYFNARVELLLGLPEGFLKPGMSFFELLDFQISSGEFANMGEEFVKFVRSGGVALTAQAYERERPNGVILDIRTIPLPDGGAVRTFADVTEARIREARIREAEEQFRSLFENSIVGIYRSTLDGRQLRANPALARLNGFESEADMLGSGNYLARDWYVEEGRREEFARIMREEGRTNDFVSEVYRAKTREKIWVSEAAWIVRDAEGDPLYYEGMVIDATDRRKAESKIAHLALHDMLTNLPNRTLFLDKLGNSITTCRKGQEVAVLCLDLDHFKEVNDTLGHDAGDILLRLAARRLSRLVPATGMAARFGGDEFAVLLTEIRDRDWVMSFAKTVVRTLSMPYRIRGKRVYVGASVGVALSPTDGNDAQDLLKKADIALYRAKRDGKGTFAFFDSGMTAAILARREVERELRDAIQNDEFELHYQPILDLEANEATAYEALIRWRHPTKGLMPPGYFIEIAEESGLILPIGEIALRQACMTFARIPGERSVSVNLSPIQFRNHQLAVSVINALAFAGLPPSRLILEITESVLLTDDQRTLDILRQLRMLGVQIALDDFGVGHSSLSYIQKFPFDKIKIDRSFVQDADDGTMNMAIRRAILGLGHDLGLDVVVEGVETEHQRDMLIFEGARYAQGYLFGKPKPASELFGEEFSVEALRKVA